MRSAVTRSDGTYIGISAVVHEPAGHRDEGAEHRSERADSSRRIELEHRAIMRG
jgi:hypothetical protein